MIRANPLLANHRRPCEELADRADGEVVSGLLRPAGALMYGTTMARRQLPGSPARRRGCVGTVTVCMRTRSARSRPPRVAHRDDTPGRSLRGRRRWCTLDPAREPRQVNRGVVPPFL